MSSPRIEDYDIISFDCYGTLVDWEDSIVSTLQDILQSHDANMNNDVVLEYFSNWEPIEQAQGGSYRQVLRRVLMSYGHRLGFMPRTSDLSRFEGCIARSVPFEDTTDSLSRLLSKVDLAVISNTDNDLFALTQETIEVEFKYVVTAQDTGHYKPSDEMFLAAFAEFGKRERVLHVAQSLYHDIAPMSKLGIDSIWIDRNQGKSGATRTSAFEPSWKYPDLRSMVEDLLH